MITNVTSAMLNMFPHPASTITRYKSIPEDSNLLVNIVAKHLQIKQGTEHILPNTLEKNLTYAGMKDVIRGEKSLLQTKPKLFPQISSPQCEG